MHAISREGYYGKLAAILQLPSLFFNQDMFKKLPTGTGKTFLICLPLNRTLTEHDINTLQYVLLLGSIHIILTVDI